jgi:Protein of unknown function (DUF2452)
MNEIQKTEELELSASYMPYPTSRLAPAIIPMDLSHFKSRGIGNVARELEQELTQIKERYVKVIDEFNWNKLIYESTIQFEPIVGQVYHLYEQGSKHLLSMIEPKEWFMKWVGTFRFNTEGRWQVIEVAEDFSLQAWVERQQ